MSLENALEKRKRRCSDCSEHIFALTGSDKDDRLTQQVSFCPKYYREKTYENTFAVFNHDRKHYTSSFILAADRQALELNQRQMLEEHKKQVVSSMQKTGKIAFPKPKKNHAMCHVCKQSFTSYFKHVMSDDHKQKVACNKYNRLILELASNFGEYDVANNSQAIKIVDSSGQSTRISQRSPKEDCDEMKNIIELVISSDSSESEYDEEYTEKSSTVKVENEESQDSVQITEVKPAKKQLDSASDDTSQKRKVKKEHKKKNKSKEKKSKKKKSRGKSKSRHKSKHKKSRKADQYDSDSSDSSSMRRRMNSTKRKPLDPPLSDPPFIHQKMEKAAKSLYRVGQRPARPAESRKQEVLIEKYAVSHPTQNVSMDQILNNILRQVNQGPPPKVPTKYRRYDQLSKTLTYDSRVNVSSRGTNEQSTFKDQSKAVSIGMGKMTESKASISGQQLSETRSAGQENESQQQPLAPIEVVDIEKQEKINDCWQNLKNEILSSINRQQTRRDYVHHMPNVSHPMPRLGLTPVKRKPQRPLQPSSSSLFKKVLGQDFKLRNVEPINLDSDEVEILEEPWDRRYQALYPISLPAKKR